MSYDEARLELIRAAASEHKEALVLLTLERGSALFADLGEERAFADDLDPERKRVMMRMTKAAWDAAYAAYREAEEPPHPAEHRSRLSLALEDYGIERRRREVERERRPLWDDIVQACKQARDEANARGEWTL